MRVQWEVEDGYVGKSRPQFTDIPDDEFEDLDEAERQQVIEDAVQQDFENNIHYFIIRVDEDR